MSQRRLVLVHPEGLLGEVILAALGDCDGTTIVGDIVHLGGRVTGEECVCIVFGPSHGYDEIRAGLQDIIGSNSLVVIVDHHDPNITLFSLSSPRIERQRMGLTQFIAQVHAALDGEYLWEPSSPFTQFRL